MSALQDLASLDRVIHEPVRLMVMTVLYAVPEATSSTCKMNAASLRETFPVIWPGWKRPAMLP